MTSLFTPRYIILRERRAKLALFLVIVATPLILFNLTLGVYASETTTYDLSSNPVTLPLTASTSDETFDDFNLGNNLSDPFAMTAFLPDGGVEINQGYAYTTETSPGLVSGTVQHTFLSNDLLYVSTYGGGLSVIDTKSTTDPGDDTLITRYHTGSTPALATNYVLHSFLNNDLLYITTYAGGLSVINTQGTVTAADDTLVTRYHTGSTPALASNNAQHTFLDNNLLYVSTYGGGVSVINTQGTVTAADDTLVTRYHTGSTPALASNNIVNSSFANNLLYVSTWGGGLSVINTQGTVTAADDTLVTRYHTGSTPALADDDVFHTFLNNNLLYISTWGGLSVINTQGTVSAADDTLVTRYHADGNPALSNDTNDLYHTFLDNNLLYISTAGGGLSVISAAGTYQPTGTYISNPRPIGVTPTTTLSVDATVSSGQNVLLSYRTGSSDSVWRDDFDTIDNYTLDPYGYGSSYDWQTATVASGTLRLSGEPSGYPDYSYFGIDTGFSNNHFQAGSQVTMRYRILNRSTDLMRLSLCSDQYESCTYGLITDEWQTVTIAPGSPFSMLLIDLYNNYGSGTQLDSTSLEIDFLQITTPDSMGEWGPWTTCASYSTCVLSDLGSAAWLQYKLDLETDDTSTSPMVTKVTFQGDYAPTSTYTSNTTTFLTPQSLGTFTPTATTPAGTAISYEYSTDGGTTWQGVTPGEDIDRTATSFTWRAHLSTTDGAYTPTITSVSLTHTAPSSRTSTSLKTRIERLEATNPDAAAALKAKYPHLFDGTARPEDIQAEIIWRLEKVIELYLRLLEEKEE